MWASGMRVSVVVDVDEVGALFHAISGAEPDGGDDARRRAR